MPLYEYRCKKCEHLFEVLQWAREQEQEKEKVKCPRCGSEEVDRQVSACGLLSGGCADPRGFFT